METTHKFELKEKYDDGIIFVECPICGASVLYRGIPFYHKTVAWGDLSIGHSYSSVGDIPGDLLSLEFK